IVSCECPHRLSDKLLKSVATLSFDINQLGRCREVMYTTFFREKVKRLFSTFSFFFHLSLPLVSFLT
ncbi:TPA: hypothetical protein ACQ499_004030, partial [Providencia stuartii]